MISIDTNILFYAISKQCSEHTNAARWLETISSQDDVAISEFVLVELYRLLRNGNLNKNPLDGKKATEVIQQFRVHPRWKIVGFTEKSYQVHQKIWNSMSEPQIAYRRIYDIRLAYTLQEHGVFEFATANVKDFQNVGFQNVWNPLI